MKVIHLHLLINKYMVKEKELSTILYICFTKYNNSLIEKYYLFYTIIFTLWC